MTDEPHEPDFYHDDKATFGDRITGAREAAGLEQEELAKKLGIKLRTLKEWEDDLSEPRANKLTMLSGVLNVSLRWLMTGHGDDLSSIGGPPTAEEIAALRTKLSEAMDMLDRIEERMTNG